MTGYFACIAYWGDTFSHCGANKKETDRGSQWVELWEIVVVRSTVGRLECLKFWKSILILPKLSYGNPRRCCKILLIKIQWSVLYPR